MIVKELRYAFILIICSSFNPKSFLFLINQSVKFVIDCN